jgi:hypothetical protein
MAFIIFEFFSLLLVAMSNSAAEEKKAAKGGGKRQFDVKAMEDALRKVWDFKESKGELPPLQPIAKEFGVPYTTFRRYVENGRRSVIDGSGQHRPPLLSKTVECNLVLWIIVMATVGRALCRRHIEAAVYGLLEAEGRAPDKKRRSRSWWKSFCKRWPALGLRRPSNLERNRALNANVVTIGRFFELLQLAFNMLKPKMLLNCDESGFCAWGTKGKSQVMFLKGAKDVYAKSSENREHMTVIATIGIILGTLLTSLPLPLFFIFKGKRIRTDVLTTHIPSP